MLKLEISTMKEYKYLALAGNLTANRGTCTISYRVFIIPHRNCKVLDLYIIMIYLYMIKFNAKFPMINQLIPIFIALPNDPTSSPAMTI